MMRKLSSMRRGGDKLTLEPVRIEHASAPIGAGGDEVKVIGVVETPQPRHEGIIPQRRELAVADIKRRCLRHPVATPFGNAHFVLALALALAASHRGGPGSQSRGQASSGTPETLWYWVTDCRDSKMMRLEVSLNRKSIYQSSFCICRRRPGDVQAEQKEPATAFTFKGGHVFQGEYRTVRAEMVEGNVWQAGAEPDGLFLGVAFVAKHRVVLNSLHFVKPDRPSESKLDPGLFIRTYPIPRSRP